MINSRGYSVARGIDQDLEGAAKKKLTVRPVQFSGVRKFSESFPVFRESSTRLYVPRAFGIETFGPATMNRCDERMQPISASLEFKGELREHQKQSVELITQNYEGKNGSCLLCLPCGYGKTCVAIYMIAKMKVKTLILVHKEFLMTQWVERIQEFLPGTRIGYIQQTKCDVEDKDVVIGMIQSVSSRDYDKSVFDQFGQLIVDESHHIAAKAFSECMFKAQAKYMLGLSATPDRTDGMTILLKWFFGTFEIPIKRPQNTSVQVDIIKNYEGFSALAEVGVPTKKETVTSVVTNLTNMQHRNELLLNKLKTLDLTKRKVLLLSDRRDHLSYLKKRINEDTHFSGFTCGLYIGGMKAAALKESEACDILLSTFTMTAEGFDVPSLNTLVMSTPKSNIEQAVGRILRKVGEVHPLVIDIYDNHTLLEGMYWKRMRFYKKCGYHLGGGTARLADRKQEGKTRKLTDYSFDDSY